MGYLLTFSEALEKAKKYCLDKNILLGNGFSIALSPIFSYKELLIEAKKSIHYINLSDYTKRLFNKRSQHDLEKIIKDLVNAKKILKAYNIDISQINNDVRLLKKILLDTIAKTHPELSTDVNENAYKICAEFLKNFKNIEAVPDNIKMLCEEHEKK